ncbi:MAG: hypothetical protein PUE47_09250 [Lachnospiraceae bacterium]|nr:hypothetical protein [Lachnospiraceae bacterium]
MNSIVNTIKNTVPISQFNRGLAGKISAEVKKYGAKVVMKTTRLNVSCFLPKNT